jgi:hypothetical protein
VTGPTLSVVITSYNYGRFLSEAIESILGQTRPPDELVIVDDVSTDDSVEVARSYAARSPIVRVVVNERNLGALHNANRGLELATGDYVHFASADDRMLPYFYESAMDLLARNPRAGLATGLVRWMSPEGVPLGWMKSGLLSPEPRYLSPEEMRLAFHREGYSLLSHATVFRRAALVEVGGFPAELDVRADGYSMIVIARRHGACFLPSYCADARVAQGAYHLAAYRAPSSAASVERAAALFREHCSDVFDEAEIEEICGQWSARLRLARLKLGRADYLASMSAQGRAPWIRRVAAAVTGLGYLLAVVALSPDRVSTLRRRLRRFTPTAR